jgi:hypothetical protein
MELSDRRHRLDALRLREAQGLLTEAERAELDALFTAIDAEEAEALRPALERMQGHQVELQREKEQLAAEAAQLESVVREQEQLVVEARTFLDQMRSRRAALAEEFQRITGRELIRLK